MKTFIKFIAALFVLLLPIVQTEAQCPNNNTQFGTSSAPVTVGQLVTLSTCIYGGEFRLVNNFCQNGVNKHGFGQRLPDKEEALF